MNIVVYGKLGCGICKAAKEKLEDMRIPFESRQLPQLMGYDESWKEKVDLLAAYSMADQKLPVISIDGRWFDYPRAMKFLKEEKGRTVAPES